MVLPHLPSSVTSLELELSCSLSKEWCHKAGDVIAALSQQLQQLRLRIHVASPHIMNVVGLLSAPGSRLPRLRRLELLLQGYGSDETGDDILGYLLNQQVHLDPSSRKQLHFLPSRVMFSGAPVSTHLPALSQLALHVRADQCLGRIIKSSYFLGPKLLPVLDKLPALNTVELHAERAWLNDVYHRVFAAEAAARHRQALKYNVKLFADAAESRGCHGASWS